MDKAKKRKISESLNSRYRYSDGIAFRPDSDGTIRVLFYETGSVFVINGEAAKFFAKISPRSKALDSLYKAVPDSKNDQARLREADTFLKKLVKLKIINPVL